MAQSFKGGGSIRGYQFARVGETLQERRRDTELFVLRLTLNAEFTPAIRSEVHGVVNLLSPPLAGASRLVSSTSRSFLPLQNRLVSRSQVELGSNLDRLSFQIDTGRVRIVAGRQAITWGVSYFWPAMDLFAPFAPQQIDRDYKPGVDALRVIVPIGSYSEVEAVGAVLGRSLSRDGSAAIFSRIYLGPIDVGWMGGRFHRDTVGGGFFTANARGTGLHGEVTWTRSGDAREVALDRTSFWRGSVGMDRQLTPEFSLSAEFSWNGFGSRQASQYIDIVNADRVQRGEINALGRWYSGVSGTWQLHPLWRFSSAILVNWGDPSCLWVPFLTWSAGNNWEVLLGAQLSVGAGLQNGSLTRSEYGSIPNTLLGAFKAYF